MEPLLLLRQGQQEQPGAQSKWPGVGKCAMRARRQPGSTNREQELHASSLIVELVSAGKPAASPAFQMEMGMLKIVDNEGYMKIKLNKHYLQYNCDLF